MPQSSENKIVSAKNYVNIGDLFSSLPGFNAMYQKDGTKLDMFQYIGFYANYNNQDHPSKDEKGRLVSMNHAAFNAVKPLILAQPYINSFEEWTGQEVDYNFNHYREQLKIELHHGIIPKWIFYSYPELTCDISQKWMTVPEDEEIKKLVDGKIILNFSSRYRNYAAIQYMFLRPFQKELIFIGMPSEHENFVEQYRLYDLERLDCSNFLEIGQALHHSRFFMGNQSAIWNLANAMDIPRALEVCEWANNCHSWNGYDYLHQSALEYAFKTLYNKFK